MLKKAPSIWAQNQSASSIGWFRLVTMARWRRLRIRCIRLVTLVALPLAAFLLIPQSSFMKAVVAIGGAAAIGLMLPPFVLLRLVAQAAGKNQTFPA